MVFLRKGSRSLELGSLPPEQKIDEMNKPKLTLAGLLNTLDGPTARTGSLIFMTTNDKETECCLHSQQRGVSIRPHDQALLQLPKNDGEPADA